MCLGNHTVYIDTTWNTGQSPVWDEYCRRPDTPRTLWRSHIIYVYSRPSSLDYKTNRTYTHERSKSYTHIWGWKFICESFFVRLLSRRLSGRPTDISHLISYYFSIVIDCHVNSYAHILSNELIRRLYKLCMKFRDLVRRKDPRYLEYEPKDQYLNWNNKIRKETQKCNKNLHFPKYITWCGLLTGKNSNFYPFLSL